MGCGLSKAEKKPSTPTVIHKERKTVIDPFQYLNLDLPLEKSYKFLNKSHLDNKSIHIIQLRDVNTAEERSAVKIAIPETFVQHLHLAERLRILLAIEHPYLQKNIRIFKREPEYILVRDDQKKTSLFEFLEKVKRKESHIAMVIESILQGLNQIHQKNIIHGDMNQESIIFKGLDISQSPIIVGYGLRDLLTDEISDKNIQSLYCRSPEALKGEHSDRSDIWSVGVLLFRIVTGKWPLDGQNRERIKVNIIKGIVSFDDVKWNDFSPRCKLLVQLMLKYRPKDRPSALQCLNSDWLKLKKKKLNKKDKKMLQRSVSKLQVQDKKQQPNKLQQITLMLIADQTASKRKHDQMMNTFRKLDTDNSGALCKAEIYNGLLTVMSEEEAKEQVEQIFQQADIDGQGEIDFYEYMMVFTKSQKLASKKKILKIFNQADMDGSGTLSLAEVKKLLVKLNLSEEEVDSMVIKLDENGDGNISQEEFVKSIMGMFKLDEANTSPSHHKSQNKSRKNAHYKRSSTKEKTRLQSQINKIPGKKFDNSQGNSPLNQPTQEMGQELLNTNTNGDTIYFQDDSVLQIGSPINRIY